MKRQMFLEIVALIIAAVGVMHLFLPLLNDAFTARASEERVVRMYVKEYLGFEPDTIVVKKGQTVRLLLIGMDSSHSFTIPDLEVDSGLVLPGERKTIEFTPMKRGIYIIYCGIVCSDMHPQMKAKLVVTD